MFLSLFFGGPGPVVTNLIFLLNPVSSASTLSSFLLLISENIKSKYTYDFFNMMFSEITKEK